MFKVAIASFFLILSPACTALASSDCATIESDIARLDCYDSLYRTAGGDSNVKDIDAALKDFRDLSEYWGEGGWKQIFFEDCRLYDHTVTGPESPFYSSIGVQQLLVDLGKIDLEKSGASAAGTRIVMVRGGEIYQSSQTFGRTQGNARVGWSPPLDINPLIWEKLTLQEGEAESLYSFNQPVRVNYFSAKNERSASWKFSIFFPEDDSEINAAFLDLVRSCQGQGG